MQMHVLLITTLLPNTASSTLSWTCLEALHAEFDSLHSYLYSQVCSSVDNCYLALQMSGAVKQAPNNSQQQGAAQPMHSQAALGHVLSRQASLAVIDNPSLCLDRSHQAGIPVTDVLLVQQQHSLQSADASSQASGLPVQASSMPAAGPLLSHQLTCQDSVQVSGLSAYQNPDAGSQPGRLGSEPLQVTDHMQLLCGYTVSSQHKAKPIAVQAEALRSLASMPPGTILLPANHTLPPGSVLVAKLSPTTAQQQLLSADGNNIAGNRSSQADQLQAAVPDEEQPALLLDENRTHCSHSSRADHVGRPDFHAEMHQPANDEAQQPVGDVQRSGCRVESQPTARSGAVAGPEHKRLKRAIDNRSAEDLAGVRHHVGVGGESGFASLSASEGPSMQGEQVLWKSQHAAERRQSLCYVCFCLLYM